MKQSMETYCKAQEISSAETGIEMQMSEWSLVYQKKYQTEKLDMLEIQTLSTWR